MGELIKKNDAVSSVSDYVLRQPRVRIVENDEEFVLQAAMPGVSESEVNVVFEHNSLRIDALRDDSSKIKYERFFRLPKTVDSERISARMKDGILTLSMPKSDVFRPRTIEVKAS